MSVEEINLENLTSSRLAGLGNENCNGCTNLKGLGYDVIEALPATEEFDLAPVIGRFAGFAALCPRTEPVPPPKSSCEDQKGLCSVVPEERKCLFQELLQMTPAERLQLVQRLAGNNNL
jgi:hypothetical protein